MISAPPGTKLAHICKLVDRMKPGERIDIPVFELADIPSFEHNNATFTPADRVLENIMGSAYTHSYRMHPSGKHVTFARHEETGDRHYQSPDRRWPDGDEWWCR